jgi:GNAT superfamily N-acetyltransferase
MSEDYDIIRWEPNKGDETHIGDVRAWREGPYEYTYVGANHPMAISNHMLMMHHVDRKKGTEMLSQLMMGHDGRISSVETNPAHRRQGHASRLINFAKKLSTKFEDFPAPSFSDNRTAAGNALAKSMGEAGVSPRVSKAQFLDRRDW